MTTKTTRKSRFQGEFPFPPGIGNYRVISGHRWKQVDQVLTRKGALEVVKKYRKKGYITHTVRNPITWDIYIRKPKRK